MTVGRATRGVLGLVVWVVWSVGGVGLAAELPDEIRADQYRLQARTALKAKDPHGAIRALEKFETVTSERRWEFLYLYGTLLAAYGTTAEKISKGHDLLIEVVKEIGKEGEPYYSAALEQLSVAEARLEGVAEEEEKAAAAYARAEAAGTAAAYAEYLAAYPQGRHAEAAEEKRKKRAAEEAKRADALRAGRRFRDCAECPEMVVVPAGTFMMGSPESEAGHYDNEGPVHRVTIGQPFAVGVYEVTFAEWDACVSGGGCNGYHPDDEGWGRGRRPVIIVSWKDAQAYVEWLSEQTGKAYRLLSEAEWEYMARAGTTTPFHFGRTISTYQANYDGNYTYGSGREGEYREKTVAVGSFSANAFGLHDVHGNVLEWTQDCWHESYAGARTDGGAWEGGDCSRRVLRGGSWDHGPRGLRSAYRDVYTAGYRYVKFGFRLARTLTP